MELIDLICTWNSEIFSSVPSPMVKKPCFAIHLKFLVLIVTSSGTEITAQAVATGEVEQNENFTGIQRNGSKFTPGRSSSRFNVEQLLRSRMWFISVFGRLLMGHILKEF